VVQTTVSLATTTSTDVAANLNRVGITIGAFIPPSILAAHLRISAGGLGLVGLTNGTTLFHATLATHGELPTKSFNILCNGATLQVGIAEYFAPEEYLRAGIEEFMRAIDESIKAREGK
jgi:hypothetical protein